MNNNDESMCSTIYIINILYIVWNKIYSNDNNSSQKYKSPDRKKKYMNIILY